MLQKHFSRRKSADDFVRKIIPGIVENIQNSMKKVFINYHSFIKTLIKSRHAVEEELEKVRTYKVSSNKRQNPTNCEVSSLGLRVANEISTYFKTTKEYHYIPNLKDGIYELTRPISEQLAAVA